jgi:protocatechuate 3,4-dioxygenase beta subunit
MNNNGGGGGDVDTTSAQKIGSGSGGEFKEGEIGVTNDVTALSAGGSTTLTVYVVSSTNTPVTATTQVSFISSCIAANKAILKNAAGTEANSVNTVNGRATMTYTANGCVGKDQVTASASLSGITEYANVDLDIQAGTVGSIQFSSATPDSISLKGSGGNETSIVRFRVVDGNGAPIENTSVTFTMSTTAGGLSLSPSTALSDSEGYVSTTINSGTVPTDVNVTATVNGSSISTSSLILKVSTGVPVQRSASLSATKFNPRGGDRDGEEVEVTMRMADDFGNPVVDDTTVTFWTEGGSIGPNCTTEDGACTVVWKSQEERPIDGRVTVLAFTSGNESFVDANTNGQYDAGEAFTDMGEAYRDDNEDRYSLNDENGYTPDNDRSGYTPDELYVNLEGGTNDHDKGDGKYSGTLCKSDDTAVCSKEKVTVRRSLVFAMSHPAGFFSLFSDAGCTTPTNSVAAPTVYVLAYDLNGNSLPSGTVVGVGDPKTSQVFSVVPNTPNAFCYAVNNNGAHFQIFSKTVEGEPSTETF